MRSILDPASCEAVTHIVPAPPPIDAETYAKSNMPFFVLEEKPEERLEGGDFENVQSVSAMDREKGVSEEQSFDPTKPVQCQCGIRLCDCVYVFPASLRCRYLVVVADKRENLVCVRATIHFATFASKSSIRKVQSAGAL
jgi:hypothetical protein